MVPLLQIYDYKAYCFNFLSAMAGEKNKAGADAGAPARFRQMDTEKVVFGQCIHGVQVLRPVRFFVTESCPGVGCAHMYSGST